MTQSNVTDLQKLIVKANKKMNIVDGEEFQNSMKAVAFVMADKVNKTIGPYAHTAIIDNGYSSYPTKDGWNIINRMEFDDPLLMSICKIIRGISFHLVTKVGDGTSTALCAASKFINLLDGINIDARQADIVKTLEIIAEKCEEILLNDKNIHNHIDLDTEEGLRNIHRIALVSSNYNTEISDMIYDIYKETKNPSIHVEIDGAEKTHYQISKGYKIQGKCLNIDMLRNTDDGSMHINEKCAILMIDHNVTYSNHMNLVMDAYQEAIGRLGARKFILMAPNYDQMFTYQIQTMLNADRHNNHPIAFVLLQVPTVKQSHKDALEDLAVIANTQIFNSMDLDTYNLVRTGDVENHTEDFGKIANSLGLDVNVLLANPQIIVTNKLGTVTNVTCSAKEFMCGMVDTERYKIHFSKVEQDFKALKERRDRSSSASDIEFTDAYMRYCRLIGNMGYIKIGGKSPLEKECLKDAVDDAVLACKAAAEKGFVRGMNISTIESIAILISQIKNNKLYDEDGNLIDIIFEGNVTGKPENDKLMYNLCATLMTSYKYATSEIFINKYCPYGTDEELQEVTTKVFDIIDNCAATRSVYNIITEEYEKMPQDSSLYDTIVTLPTNKPDESIDIHYALNVVNPVSTDIEVLKAIVGILSHVLTSNQLQSMGKFMRNMETPEELLEKEIAKWTEVGGNIVSIYLAQKAKLKEERKVAKPSNKFLFADEETFANEPVSDVEDETIDVE